MKSIHFRLFANIALLVCLLAWVYGGARLGFYHTYYTKMLVDPITTLESPVTVNTFLPGIETLVLGLFAFAGLQLVSNVLEARAVAQAEK